MACPSCQGPESGAHYCPKCNRYWLGSDMAAPPRDRIIVSKGEQRLATVLLSDLSGFTEMCGVDSEEALSIVRRLREAATEVVEGFGGTINQFVGDQIISLFGIPLSGEQDPLNAAHAAIELRRAIGSGSFGRTIVEHRRLGIHQAIATGKLVVVEATDTRSGRFDVTGDAINAAARLLTLAEQDAILCSESTKREIAQSYRCESLASVALKGFSTRATPWRLVERSAADDEFPITTPHGLTPLAGRDEEIAVLRSAFERAATGQGRCVAVLGDAGVGKSRLAREFLSGVVTERAQVAAGRCRRAAAGTPYLPFVEVMRRLLRLDRTGSELPDVIARRILTQDAALGPYVPYLLFLLGVRSEDYAVDKKLSSDALRTRLYDAILRFMKAAGEEQPLVITFEDWHWADEASVTLLRWLSERIQRDSVLLLVLSRTEASSDDALPPVTTTVELEPLNLAHTEQILRCVLDTDQLPFGLAQAIHTRTGGNPLFAEEIARSLADGETKPKGNGTEYRTAPARDITLPNSVQAVIASRLDQLDLQDRNTLRVASVLGTQFDRAVLESVLESTHRLDASLERLAVRDLVHRTDDDGHEYAFKHVLTQEVAYDTLLASQRRSLHLRAGESIERHYHEVLGEYYEPLAVHFRRGNELEKAIDYTKRVADQAASRHLFTGAIEKYKEAIADLDTLPMTDDRKRQRIDYSVACGRLASTYPTQGMREVLTRSHDYAVELGDARRVARVGLNLGRVCWLAGRFSEARHVLRHAMSAASDIDDETTVAAALGNIGHTFFYEARFTDAIQDLERATAGVATRTNAGAQTLLSYLSLSYAFTGRFPESRHLQESILSSATESQNRLSEQVIRLWMALRWSVQGQWRDALTMYDTTLALGSTLADYIEGYARCGRAFALFMLGARDALREYDRGLDILAARGHRLAESYYRAACAELCALSGQLDLAQAHATKALDFDRHGEQLGEVQARRALAVAESQRSHPRHDKANEAMAQAVKQAEVRRQRPDEAVSRFRWAEILHREKAYEPAIKQLAAAERMFASMGMVGWRRKAQTLRRDLETARPSQGFVPTQPPDRVPMEDAGDL